MKKIAAMLFDILYDDWDARWLRQRGSEAC